MTNAQKFLLVVTLGLVVACAAKTAPFPLSPNDPPRSKVDQSTDVVLPPAIPSASATATVAAASANASASCVVPTKPTQGDVEIAIRVKYDASDASNPTQWWDRVRKILANEFEIPDAKWEQTSVEVQYYQPLDPARAGIVRLRTKGSEVEGFPLLTNSDLTIKFRDSPPETNWTPPKGMKKGKNVELDVSISADGSCEGVESTGFKFDRTASFKDSELVAFAGGEPAKKCGPAQVLRAHLKTGKKKCMPEEIHVEVWTTTQPSAETIADVSLTFDGCTEDRPSKLSAFANQLYKRMKTEKLLVSLPAGQTQMSKTKWVTRCVDDSRGQK